MCHMICKDLETLHEMADKIGVARKWFQGNASFPHYDICLSKKKIALKLGAVEIDRYQLVKFTKKHRTKVFQQLKDRQHG